MFYCWRNGSCPRPLRVKWLPAQVPPIKSGLWCLHHEPSAAFYSSVTAGGLGQGHHWRYEDSPPRPPNTHTLPMVMWSPLLIGLLLTGPKGSRWAAHPLNGVSHYQSNTDDGGALCWFYSEKRLPIKWCGGVISLLKWSIFYPFQMYHLPIWLNHFVIWPVCPRVVMLYVFPFSWY